jgi:polyhydroxyalkanoate synthesis regulator phasin
LEYIRGLRKSLETKKAEIVGENPSTIPGSEHDSKPDPNAKKPDPEVKDQTMVPNSGLTTDGAGDDSKITHTNDLTAEQAALTPTKKPEVTDEADAKTAEKLAAEIITDVDAWYAAKKEAEQKKAEDAKPTAGTPPSAGTGTAEALITDTGKEPEQTGAVAAPTKKPEVTTDAMAPATGEGSVGETAQAAKAAEGASAVKEDECCKDGKCGKCSKCKAAATDAKKAGALDMELTSDVLAKIAAVMLATEEGTKLAESLLSKAAGAEAAEKTLNFLREQNDLAQKQAEFEAGQRDATIMMLRKAAAEGDQEAAAALAEAGLADDAAVAADDAGITEIADTLDAMVESGEITEDEADQVVLELAQALQEGDGAGAAAPDAGAAAEGEGGEAKAAQAAPDAGAAATDAGAAGNAAIDQTVAVDPSQLDPSSLPQGGTDDITVDDVADAIDSLVQSGEITEDEADQLVQEIVDGEAGAAEGAGGEDVSPEQIATALQEAVASGELKPEEVQQVLTELENVPAPEAGTDAGTDAAVAADAAGAAAAADNAAAADATVAAGAAGAAGAAAEPKTAGAKLLAAINAVRATRAGTK